MKALVKDSVREYVAATAKQQEPRADEKEFYTAKEVRKVLGVTDVTLWRWGKVGYLVPVRQGGRRYWRSADVLNLRKGGAA